MRADDPCECCGRNNCTGCELITVEQFRVIFRLTQLGEFEAYIDDGDERGIVVHSGARAAAIWNLMVCAEDGPAKVPVGPFSINYCVQPGERSHDYPPARP